jgi:hypothetical protein
MATEQTTVYLAYECSWDGCEVRRDLVRIFDDEVKAFVWSEEIKATDSEWREYRKMQVE